MRKEKCNLLVFFFFLIFLTGFILPEELVSDTGVIYDSEIWDSFRKYPLVDVIIKVKDFSNITISSKDSQEVQISKDKQRNEIFNNITDSVLLTLSKDEFIYKDRTISGRTSFGYITEKGFNKLLNNSNVKAIYIEKYIPLFGEDKLRLPYEVNYKFFFIVISIILIVIIFVIYFIIKKIKKKKK